MAKNEEGFNQKSDDCHECACSPPQEFPWLRRTRREE